MYNVTFFLLLLHTANSDINFVALALLQNKRSGKRSKSPKANLDLNQVKEHGILFECAPDSCTDQKKSDSTIMYWVVG